MNQTNEEKSRSKIVTGGRSKPSEDPFQETLFRMEKKTEVAKQFRDALESYAAGKPQTISCQRHSHVVRKLNLERSSAASWEYRKARPGDPYSDNYAGLKPGTEAPWVLVYNDCAECAKDAKYQKQQGWLHSIGVPQILIEASFQTFKIDTTEDEEAVRVAREFVRDKVGFLFMNGSLGDGKSFLAVAILREFGDGRYISHNDLLVQVRKGYKDPGAVDWLKRYQDTPLLVLDDVGFSTGGRDDVPMIHHILDHRHNEKKPTVITSNLPYAECLERLGDRMANRVSQSLYRKLTFTGASHRAAMRGSYLAQ